MEGQGQGAGENPPPFLFRRSDHAWVFDTKREEFLKDPGIPEELWPEIIFHVPSDRERTLPRTRRGRLYYWLFYKGGMSAVVIGGLVILALVAALIGIR